MEDLKKIGIYFRFTILFILIIAILLMGGLWIYSSYSTFNKDSKKLKEEYITSQKYLIQNEVDRVIEEINHQKSTMKVKLKEDLRERGYEAYDIAMNIYEINKNNKSNKEIEQIISNIFSGVTFNNGRGYFFGGRNQDGILLFDNGSKFEGSKILNYKNSQGEYTFKDMQQVLSSKGEGFYEYIWAHPDTPGYDHRKISFLKLLKPLNIWIGTGEYYEDFKNEEQQELLDKIKRISFGKDGYIFVSDFDGLNLTTGDKNQSQLIGTNEWELEGFHGVKIVQEMAKAAKKKDGGFTYYKWYKPTKDQPVDKITFVKKVPDWNWMVGTGVYLDDINDTIQIQKEMLRKRVIEHIVEVCFLIFFLVSLTLLFELRVMKRIKSIIKYEENVYNTLLNLSIDGISLENDNGKILDCNENIHKMLGYTKKEFLNLSLDDLEVKKEDIQNIDLNLSKDHIERNSYKEVTFIKKDGTFLIGEINTSILEVAKNKRQITFLRDITQRKILEKHLKELSIRDGLTQLYNRRYIFKLFKLEIEKFEKNNHPLSISIIDIDHFKKINDRFGHIMGDEVLKNIANVLGKNLRHGDHIGRYGGEEFLIILPNTRSEEALEIIQRIKTIINELVWKEKDLKVSFSGGIVEINLKNSYDKLEDAIDIADKLLYKAKDNGRNQIEVLVKN